MRRRALVTGVTGFVGSHLAELLVRTGAQVHGLTHEGGPHPNLAAVRGEVALHRADLLAPEEITRAVREARPEVVFHLAAQAVPAASWRNPRATVETNVLGTLDLLEGLRALGSVPLLVLASTAEVYADAREDQLPLREDFPLGPRSPYAASKLGQETLVAQYARAGIVRSVILRAANQVGPRLSRELAASAFAAQVAEAEAGAPRVVRVGDLGARRDFVDVRDVARAYLLAVEQGEPEAVYNVGTGAAVPVRTVLDILLAESRVPLSVEEDPERMRPDDRRVVALNATALRERTGWSPAIPLVKSLRDTLDHWRDRVGRTAHAGREA